MSIGWEERCPTWSRTAVCIESPFGPPHGRAPTRRLRATDWTFPPSASGNCMQPTKRLPAGPLPSISARHSPTGPLLRLRQCRRRIWFWVRGTFKTTCFRSSHHADHYRTRATGSTSSYWALYRPQSLGPVIISMASMSASLEGPRDYLVGAMQVLRDTDNEEFDGPPMGDETHYFRGTLDDGRLKRYTALWRYPNVFCEVAVASPSGRFKASDARRYAALQNKRAPGCFGTTMRRSSSARTSGRAA
jgi:hypothetical protein